MRRHLYIFFPLIFAFVVGIVVVRTLSRGNATDTTVMAHQYQQIVAATIISCGQTYECGPGTFAAFATRVQHVPFPCRLLGRTVAVQRAARTADAAARTLTSCRVGCADASTRYHAAVAHLIHVDGLLRHDLGISSQAPGT